MPASRVLAVSPIEQVERYGDPRKVTGSLAWRHAPASRHAAWSENRQEPPGFWNLRGHPFLSRITDSDIREVFERRFTAEGTPPDPEQILKRVGERGGWDQEDLERLAAISKADYVSIFKRVRGSELRSIVTGGVIFRDLTNADE
jgi:hypothetical protein